MAWNLQISGVLISEYLFLKHTFLWLNGRKDVGHTDSCLMDVTLLKNVPEKKSYCSKM
jgi:hypothetical protein